MSDSQSGNLPWLDRLTMSVPGYGGYDDHGHRRSAAFALRDMLLKRLSMIRTRLDRTRAACFQREAHTEVHALQRVATHLDHIMERVGGLGTRVVAFYDGPDLDRERVAPIYAIDHAIVEVADRIGARFEEPDVTHDFLARLEADLRELEDKLDERAMLIRKII